MPRRSKRWALEISKRKCKCGARAQHMVNVGSKERLVRKHQTPERKICPEWEWQEGVERTRRICEEAGIPWE